MDREFRHPVADAERQPVAAAFGAPAALVPARHEAELLAAGARDIGGMIGLLWPGDVLGIAQPALRLESFDLRDIFGAYDPMIAGIACSQGLVPATNDMREFARVEGLRVQRWLRGQVEKVIPLCRTTY